MAPGRHRSVHWGQRFRVVTTAASTAAITLSTGTGRTQQTPQSLDRFDRLANLPFEQNRPTEQTAQTLKDELLFQRATQTICGRCRS